MPRISNLIYLTQTVPISGGFSLTELNQMHKHFNRIDVLTYDNGLHYKQIDDKFNSKVKIHYVETNFSTFEKLKSLFNLLNFIVLNEIFWLVRYKSIKLNFYTVYTCCYYYALGIKVSKKIDQIVRGRHSSETTSVYSFWLTHSALGIALFKRKNPKIRTVARGHGSDVYFNTVNAPFIPFHRYIFNNTDRLIFVSRKVLEYFKQNLNLENENRLEVLHLGTYLEHKEKKIKIQTDSKKLILMTCSLMVSVKRLDLLVRSIRKIKIAVEWHHIGAGGNEQVGFKEQVKLLPKNVEIVMHGYIDQLKVVDLMYKIAPHTLINVSSSEGLPVSMMEAMSIGVPCIGTNVGGVSEIIDHGSNGFLLTSNPSEEEIVDCLNKYNNLEPELKENFSLNAKQTWKAKFNTELNTDKVSDLLAS